MPKGTSSNTVAACAAAAPTIGMVIQHKLFSQCRTVIHNLGMMRVPSFLFHFAERIILPSQIVTNLEPLIYQSRVMNEETNSNARGGKDDVTKKEREQGC